MDEFDIVLGQSTRPYRQRPLRVGVSALLLVTLSSCIPVKLSGYLPSGPGKLEGRYCGGPGIKDALRIQADSGVQIEIRASQNKSNDSIELSVLLIVPTTVTVQLLSPAFVLQSREWAQPRLLPIDRILGSGPRSGPNRYGPADKLTGASGSPGRFSFWFLKADKGTLFQTGLPKVDSFTLQFPPMHIDDKIYRMEPIAFEAYSKWSVYTCVQ